MEILDFRPSPTPDKSWECDKSLNLLDSVSLSAIWEVTYICLQVYSTSANLTGLVEESNVYNKLSKCKY